MNVKEFFAKKGVGFYLTVATAVLSLLGCILFGVSRENKFVAPVVLLILALVACCVVAVKPFFLTEYLPLVFTAIPAGMIIVILLNNVADIFAKNNMLGLSGTFVTSVVFVVLAMIVSALATVFKQEK